MAKELNSLLENIDPDEDLNFYGVDVLDHKEFTMFIKKCEFLCRKSQEYDVWQRRTKAMAVNQNAEPDRNDAENCPICGIEYQYAPAESHHHPVTLFNLCVRQFQEWIDNMEIKDKRPLDLIQEVMEKHLCNEVEHVVLCKHCHEKYHNGEQITKEVLQIIIDYKRSIKLESYPTSVKEMLELKRKQTETQRKNRQEFTNITLNNLHSDVSKEDLIKDLLSDNDGYFDDQK